MRRMEVSLSSSIRKRVLIALAALIVLHLFISSARMSQETLRLDSRDSGHVELHALGNASHAEMARIGKYDVEKFHIILMYPVLRISTLCTVESLVLALLRGSPKAAEGSLRPAVVFVWLSHDSQQGEFFAYLEDVIRRTNSSRPVHLVRKAINFQDEIKGTVLEDFYKGKKKSELGVYGEQNKGNALRLALVQKYGRCY